MKICVFCGSSSGNESFLKAGRSVGEYIAKNDHQLVYGGASIGVMGAMADSCLSNGGEVYGVMPTKLVNREVSHSKLTHFEEVNDMHIRKKKMYDMSDVFVALPGGIGTLDELCEIITWAQIDYHTKPIYILNHDGFFDHFLNHLQHTVNEGFVAKDHLDLFKVITNINEIEL